MSNPIKIWSKDWRLYATLGIVFGCHVLGLVVLPRLAPTPISQLGGVSQMAACLFVWLGSIYSVFIDNTPKFLR